MEVSLKNIGIIKDSTILLDGLTVITGKNSSGKTTIGKTVHSILRANCNAEEAFTYSKATYIKNQIEAMYDILMPRGMYSSLARNRFIRSPSIENMDEKDVLQMLIFRQYRRMEPEELSSFLTDLITFLTKAKSEDFLKAFGEIVSDQESHKAGERYQESFSERLQGVLEIGNKTLETVNSPIAYTSFLHLRIQEFLNYDFHNQIKPVKNKRLVSNIVMKNVDQICINIKIRSKNDFEYSKDSTFAFPFERSVFVYDPYALDHIDAIRDSYIRYIIENSSDDDRIHSANIPSYSEEMERMLTINLNDNFFNMQDFQEKYHELFEKINEIVPGEFQETKDGRFYVTDGTKLSVHNLATGSKFFFLIKQLIMNGYIRENTLLILDEPESHLHPEWINRFAEIIVLLIREMGVQVLITTHSPNMQLALDVYSKKNDLKQKTHFYLAKQIENSWVSDIENIDDKLGEGYGHLSVPFLEMTFENQQEENTYAES